MRNKKLKQEEIENQEPDTKHNFALFVPEIKHNDWKEKKWKSYFMLKDQ